MRQGITGKRLLIIGNFLSGHPGKSRGVCEDLAPRLQQAGWQVLTSSHYLPRLARVADMIWSVVRLRNQFDVAQVDLYSGPAFAWAEAICWTLRRLGKPYVLTLHGGALPEFAAKQPERVKRLLLSAAAITAPSPYLRDQLAIYRSDLLLLANGLDLGAYPFRKRDVLAPRLMWLRALHEIYNPLMAVRTLHRVKAAFPQATLTMCGPDKNDGTGAKLRTLIGELGLHDSITLLDQVPKSKVPEIMNLGDVFLNTSSVDNTPVTVVEAMACGLCVVSTNVGGMPYLVQSGREAILVAADDDEAMAEGIVRLLEDPNMASRMQQAGRQNAELRDWTEIIPQWDRLLESVANHTRGRQPSASSSRGKSAAEQFSNS